MNTILAKKDDFPKTWAEIYSALDVGVTPGLVAGVWSHRHNDEIVIFSAGLRQKKPQPLPTTPETVYDLASVSKVFATATLAAVLFEKGWLNWNQPVRLFFPQYPFPDVQIRHLLSHTAGYAAWGDFYRQIEEYFSPQPLHLVSISDRQNKMREIVLHAPREHGIEQKAVYSDLSFLLLGFVLEELTSLPLDQAVQKYVFKPLGLKNSKYIRTTFPPAHKTLENVAATSECAWRKTLLQGQVEDENCWAMGGYGGHAGVFATIYDLMVFSQSLLKGFLSPHTLNQIWSKVNHPSHCERTLGWDTPSGESSSSGRYFSAQSVGHLGFTGTSLWIDPMKKTAVSLLTNRVHPTRENILIRSFRPKFHDALIEDLSTQRW